MRWIDYDKWQEIFDSLRRHKLRTALTVLSVWWGIFMLVILMGAGNGLQNSVEHNFRDDAINSLWIYRGKTSKPYKGLPEGRFISFNNQDYDVLRSEVDNVEYLTGRYYLSGEYFVSYKRKSLSFDVRSVHPDHQLLENTIMTEGRFLNQKDLDLYRKVCVIGELVKEGLFEENDAVGEYIRVKGVDYRVVGVFTDTGGENELRKIYLPISTAQKVYSGTDRIHQLMLTMKESDKTSSEQLANEVRVQLAALHKFDPTDKQAIYINNNVEEFSNFKTVFAFIKAFIWFVGIGSIIAGVIGVSNIMLIIVKERTREIGVRKALGATPRSIISMILQESVFLTAISGYLGLLSGFIVVYGLNAIMVKNEIETEFFRNPEVDFGTVFAALVLLVVCGALAGLIPALQAVRINPVTAMRQ